MKKQSNKTKGKLLRHTDHILRSSLKKFNALIHYNSSKNVNLKQMTHSLFNMYTKLICTGLSLRKAVSQYLNK